MSQTLTMEKPDLAFRSPQEDYIAGACIVWCFDHRFWGLLNEFLKERFSDVHFDLVMLAGGAESLATNQFPGSLASNRFRDPTVLDQIVTSIKLHETNRVILMTHSDCGAFGGLSAFGDDPEREFAAHSRILVEVATYVKQKLGEKLEVEAYFADFDGLHRVN